MKLNKEKSGIVREISDCDKEEKKQTNDSLEEVDLAQDKLLHCKSRQNEMHYTHNFISTFCKWQS